MHQCNYHEFSFRYGALSSFVLLSSGRLGPLFQALLQSLFQTGRCGAVLVARAHAIVLSAVGDDELGVSNKLFKVLVMITFPFQFHR